MGRVDVEACESVLELLAEAADGVGAAEVAEESDAALVEVFVVGIEFECAAEDGDGVFGLIVMLVFFSEAGGGRDGLAVQGFG